MNKFTEKDLAYISDMFDWNLQTLKLVNHFINEAERDEVKELLEEIYNMHYENLNICTSILSGEYENKEYETENEEDEEEEEEDE